MAPTTCASTATWSTRCAATAGSATASRSSRPSAPGWTSSILRSRAAPRAPARAASPARSPAEPVVAYYRLPRRLVHTLALIVLTAALLLGLGGALWLRAVAGFLIVAERL